MNKLFKYVPIAEGFCVAVFAAGFLLKYLSNSYANEIIIISLSSLSMIYFLGGYAPPEKSPDENQKKGFADLLKDSIAPKVFWIGASVVVVGVLFTLMHFNGAKEMLIIGTSSLGTSTGIILFLNMNAEAEREKLGKLLLRAVPLLLIGVYLLLTLPPLAN